MTALARDLLGLFAALPPWVAAVLIGWACSIALTQPLKFAMPLAWPERTRHAVAYCVAVASAFVPALLWMVDAQAGYVGTVLTAAGAGLWSPLAFALLQRGLRATTRWAWIADVLSGDVRRGAP